MKSGMLIPLLFLSLVIHETQGLRFILSNTQHFKRRHQAIVKMTTNEEVNSVWKSKHLSGRARKLMNTSPIPTIDKKENDKNKEKTTTKEESLSVDSSSAAEQRQPATDQRYPDILDIAGMDYSQARRKPPIHN